ncbi:rhodanese-like domain-containing protein [Bergeyella sp. RCAD1439]|uniref:rhodanese-like domain-containing protein n=1 Tax=Bergeyella anatis TaxID=3113737 RepID=UPI002E1853AC|nr:rhodanese-like domain-containing protein [Bergeyella sp. RCAD1439]
MFELVRILFGGLGTDFRSLWLRGAQVVDVRTKAEYHSGHLFNSKNIPLEHLLKKLGELDIKRPVIVCCSSGVRSESAQKLLKRHGFEAYDGGDWVELQRKITEK